MKKSAYICNAENLQREAIHTPSTSKCVPSSSTSASRSCGFSAKNIRRVRSLFVQNAKLVTTMLKTNKQAMKAKNSNLSHVKTSIVGTIAAGGLILFIGGTSAIWNILGIVCIAVAGILNSRWNDNNDYSAYANEFVNYEE